MLRSNIKLVLTFDDKPINVSTTEEIEWQIVRTSGRPLRQKKNTPIGVFFFVF